MISLITPIKSYRLPQRTLDQLDMLIKKGVVRNATEGIILSVDRLSIKYEDD